MSDLILNSLGKYHFVLHKAALSDVHLKVILSRPHINYCYFIKSLLFKLPQYKLKSKQIAIPMSRRNRRTK